MNKRSDYKFEQWHLAIFGVLLLIGGIGAKMVLHVKITTILIGIMLSIVGFWPTIQKFNNKSKYYNNDYGVEIEVKARNPRLRR